MTQPAQDRPGLAVQKACVRLVGIPRLGVPDIGGRRFALVKAVSDLVEGKHQAAMVRIEQFLPGGIRIGQLAEEPHMTDLGYAEATVKLWANPGALDEVWVLMQ